MPAKFSGYTVIQSNNSPITDDPNVTATDLFADWTEGVVLALAGPITTIRGVANTQLKHQYRKFAKIYRYCMYLSTAYTLLLQKIRSID